MAKTVSIKNWSEYQHYKDRSAPWIKLHRDILTSNTWVMGTDLSRLVQVASTLLAIRYSNAIPLHHDFWKRVLCLDCSAQQFNAAVTLLVDLDYFVIHGDTSQKQSDASNTLATCTSEGEGEGEERERRIERHVETDVSTTVVFDHWRKVHNHPTAKLDAKRRKAIKAALASYTADQLCECITGYTNSPHHMGQNDRATVYDEIALFLRDSAHIDAGIKFLAEPPRTDLSKLTRKNVAAITDWTPPEARNAIA